MRESEKTPKVELDRKRLLGFDQSRGPADAGDEGRLADPRMAKLGLKGARVGRKGGNSG